MTTTPTQGTNAASQGASSVPPTNPSMTMDENSFLKLLVAQLKYQDPLSPTDNQQFIQEQAQFATVEGINNVKSSIQSLLASEQQSQAVSLIGKQVTYQNADGSTSTGVVDSVSTASGALMLSVAGVDVDPATVIGVAKGPQTPTPITVTVTAPTTTTTTPTTTTETPGA
jgi:flagellar basal-body rod modification protein FlgD